MWPGPTQTSTIESFTTIVNGWKAIKIVANLPILDVYGVHGYASALLSLEKHNTSSNLSSGFQITVVSIYAGRTAVPKFFLPHFVMPRWEIIFERCEAFVCMILTLCSNFGPFLRLTKTKKNLGSNFFTTFIIPQNCYEDLFEDLLDCILWGIPQRHNQQTNSCSKSKPTESEKGVKYVQ